MSSDEASVLYAKGLLESVLGRRLILADEGGPGADVDLRTLKPPALAVEVKRITNSNLRVALARRHRGSTWVPSRKLQRHWGLACGVDPPPDFDLVRRKIEAYLLVLEAHDVWESRSWEHERLDHGSAWEVQKAVWAITRLLSGGIALASEPSGDLPAGIDINVAHGGASSIDADVFAEQVVAWVRSDDGAKLRWKLETCSDDERHAVVVLDRAHPTDLGRSPHHLRGQLPREVFELPEMIDSLWIGQPDVLAWRYRRDAGWIAAVTSVEHAVVVVSFANLLANGWLLWEHRRSSRGLRWLLLPLLLAGRPAQCSAPGC